MAINRETLNKLDTFYRHKTNDLLMKLSCSNRSLCDINRNIKEAKGKFLDVLVSVSKRAHPRCDINAVKLFHIEITNYSKARHANQKYLEESNAECSALFEEYHKAKTKKEHIVQMELPYVKLDENLRFENEALEIQNSAFYASSAKINTLDESHSKELKAVLTTPYDPGLQDAKCIILAELPNAGSYTIHLRDSKAEINVLINGDGAKEKRHARYAKRSITRKLGQVRNAVNLEVKGDG